MHLAVTKKDCVISCFATNIISGGDFSKIKMSFYSNYAPNYIFTQYIYAEKVICS